MSQTKRYFSLKRFIRYHVNESYPFLKLIFLRRAISRRRETRSNEQPSWNETAALSTTMTRTTINRWDRNRTKLERRVDRRAESPFPMAHQ